MYLWDDSIFVNLASQSSISCPAGGIMHIQGTYLVRVVLFLQRVAVVAATSGRLNDL